MDKLQWFKFSYADWRMGKIQRCSEITQARFINLCCLYWSKEANLSYEDAEIEIDKEHLEVLLSKKIIERDDEHIFIKFLDEQLEDIAETSKGKSKAANIRWKKYREKKASEVQTDADAMHVHTDAMQNDAEKRREDKIREDKIRENKDYINIKEEIDYNKFLEWFNSRRTSYLEIPSNIKRLTAEEKTSLRLLKLDYTSEDFETAIHNLCNDKWANENSQVLPSYFLKVKTFTKFLSINKIPIITKKQKTNRGWAIC